MIYRIREWGLLATLRWYYMLWRMRRHTADIKKKACELTGLTDHEVFIQVDKNGAVNINLYPVHRRMKYICRSNTTNRNLNAGLRKHTI